MKIKILCFAFLMFASAQIAMASHVPSTPGGSQCYDLKGSGKAVLVGGVGNSGVVGFEQTAGAPEHKYEACVRNLGGGTAGPFRLEGWAWNSNLGWISFYCPAGAGALNLGVSCAGGTYKGGYGVTIDADGNFDGYAWGDNTGWIRFNNLEAAASRVRVETKDPACQGYVYGNTPPPSPPGKTCKHGSVPADGPKWTHAWSDNVGWIDFDGIAMPWFTVSKKFVKGTRGTPKDLSSLAKYLKDPKTPPLPPLSTLPDGVTVQIFPDDIRDIKDKGKALFANGADKYTVRVNIFTGSGEPINGDRYKIILKPQWKDTVKMNQTTTKTKNCSALSASTPALAGEPACAVTKPLSNVDFSDSSYKPFPGIFEAPPVTSKAPTSSMNRSPILTSKAGETFSNESFIIKPFDGNIEENNLKLENIRVSIKDNDTKECVFSETGDCDSGIPIAPLISGELHFKPLSEITTLYDKKGADIIEATINNDTDFTVESTGSGAVDFMLGIDPASGVEFKFLENKASTLINKTFPGLSTIIKARPFLPSGGAEAYIRNPYLYTTVTDKFTGAKYFSNKLPRVEGGIVVNPIALFRGNIYTSGLTSPGKTQVLRSLGDVSTNIIRNTIFKNVKNIVTGVSDFTSGTVTVNGFNSDSGRFTLSPAASVKLLLPDKNKAPRVYYLNNGDLYLDRDSGSSGSSGGSSAKNLNWKGNRTFIVIGGNVYIKSNLYNALPATKGDKSDKPTLGIIVLKDLSAAAALQKKQGHVYIHPDVTNIQANIFADGTVFSYDPVQGIDPVSGEPKFDATGDKSAKEVLKKRQLLIEGSVASQDTVGGSLKDPPVLGDGTKLTDSQTDIDRARLYDLNYLRWYGGVVKLDSTGKPVGTRYTKSSDGSPCNKDDGEDTPEDKCALGPPSEAEGYKAAKGLDMEKDFGSVYIYFTPPPADLPGFGVTSALEQRQLQR